MQMNGSQIILEILLEHGVDTVFGYPGGAILNLYDALYDYKDRIKHILTAHEQGASHAADGYARVSGKTGVVFATSGPGATNLVTGIATAFMDSVPMVAITANVGSSLIGRDAFQEVCITGITLPITKHNFFVNRIEDLIPSLRAAFQIANSGRKGPVLVDITKDVTGAMYDYEPAKPAKIKKLPKPKQFVIEELALMIKTSKRPLIYFGGGVVSGNAENELRELVEKADIYATHTLMGAGVLGYDHPKNLGLIGMHGKAAANSAVAKCDLVIALGTRFSDRVALNPECFAKDAIRVHIDIDKSEINKNVHVDLGICAEIKDVLKMLNPLVEKVNHTEWDEFIEKQKKRDRVVKAKPDNLHPSEVITAICDNTDKETIYVTDVGQHQMWAAQYIKHRKTKQFLTSGGLGTMGYGYGAAIGAQEAFPKKRVIHITGDGSFHMNMNEASTAVSKQLPIITVIINNKVLGMVYQWQGLLYKKRYSETTVTKNSDYVKLAEGFGGIGYRATTLEEFKTVFKKALKVKDRPVWIECIIDKEERVLPMIPNGGTIDNIIED